MEPWVEVAGAALFSAGLAAAAILTAYVVRALVGSVVHCFLRSSNKVRAAAARFGGAAAAAGASKPNNRKQAGVQHRSKQQAKPQQAKPQQLNNFAKLSVSPPAPAAPAPQGQSLKKAIAQLKAKPHAALKVSVQRHHLELNTLKGHTDAICGIAFTSSASALASACADSIVRVFKLEHASSRNYQTLRLTVPAARGTPCGVAFGGSDDEVLVATQELMGAGLLMYGPSTVSGKASQPGKTPQLEMRWEKRQIHGKEGVLTCTGVRPGNSRPVIVVTCSEGTDIKLWSPEASDCIATIDSNQLRNTMAAISPDGRFVIAAAFTADVKVWEVLYGKDGKVRDVVKVMLLKGHKSAVTWACFTWDSRRVVTASKDGAVRVWNIDVRYHLDEDPKCMSVFPIPGEAAQLDQIAVSPDAKMLAAVQGSTLSWLSMQTGEVLDTAPNAHDGTINGLCWAPLPLPTTDDGNSKRAVLATCGVDKKLKLWCSPPV